MWVNPASPMKPAEVDPESYITLCSVQGEPLPPGENSQTICRWWNVDWGHLHAQSWLESPFSPVNILCNPFSFFIWQFFSSFLRNVEIQQSFPTLGDLIVNYLLN